jgi:D-alanyl-D-alanine carboxypeptidase/D-alanyl-D-alanine endopeptidase (penicillin-binding protein 7)
MLLRPVVIAASVMSLLLAGAAARAASAGGDVKVGSAHAIVVDEATGEVLFNKNAAATAPIASLTKLMTAMVVLDAKQDPQEELRIEEVDTDRLKHTKSGVPVGAVLTRTALLELALMASDNRAAAALARHYPGGHAAFNQAVRRKIAALAMTSTTIEEPTGLSPHNVSNAHDMAKLLRAAAGYAEISRITSLYRHTTLVNGEPREVRNTNWLLGEPGWEILLSKTGFTREAGRCLTMRLRTGGRTVLMVLMGAGGSAERILDAVNIRRWLGGAAAALGIAAAPAAPGTQRLASAARPVARVTPLLIARAGGYRRGDGALQPTPEQLAALAAAAEAAESQEGGGEEERAESEAPGAGEPAVPQTVAPADAANHAGDDGE